MIEQSWKDNAQIKLLSIDCGQRMMKSDVTPHI